MTIALTSKKKQKIKGKVEKLVTKSSTIREVFNLLGGIVGYFEAVLNGRLHYWHIEFDNTSASKQNKGNFEAKCYLSPFAIVELKYYSNIQ